MVEEMKSLEKSAVECRLCELWKNREKLVFGEGPVNAKIMLIGLGPGYWENKKGRPFVGAAGKLLNTLLALAGLKREEVYITNVVKCYLPDNTVTEEEVKICTSHYLDKQISIIKPKIIITLGNVATRYIFEKFGIEIKSMGKIHGKIFHVSNLFINSKIIPMYHPAAALRNPSLRSIIEEDWKLLGKILNEGQK